MGHLFGGGNWLQSVHMWHIYGYFHVFCRVVWNKLYWCRPTCRQFLVIDGLDHLQNILSIVVCVLGFWFSSGILWLLPWVRQQWCLTFWLVNCAVTRTSPPLVGVSGYGCLQVLCVLLILCAHFLSIYDVLCCSMVGFHGPVWYPPLVVYIHPLHRLLLVLEVLVLEYPSM